MRPSVGFSACRFVQGLLAGTVAGTSTLALAAVALFRFLIFFYLDTQHAHSVMSSLSFLYFVERDTEALALEHS